MLCVWSNQRLGFHLLLQALHVYRQICKWSASLLQMWLTWSNNVQAVCACPVEMTLSKPIFQLSRQELYYSDMCIYRKDMLSLKIINNFVSKQPKNISCLWLRADHWKSKSFRFAAGLNDRLLSLSSKQHSWVAPVVELVWAWASVLLTTRTAVFQRKNVNYQWFSDSYWLTDSYWFYIKIGIYWLTKTCLCLLNMRTPMAHCGPTQQSIDSRLPLWCLLATAWSHDWLEYHTTITKYHH